MRIALRGVSKSFGTLRAVDGVDLELRGGEVTALLGENGAGKSTLMKLLYGAHLPDAGRIEIDGQAADIRSPRQAIARGVGMVFQSFSLFPALSVLENLLLSWPRAAWFLRGDQSAALARLSALAPGIDPGRRVAELGVGERQLVELARVLNGEAGCVILDEPTAVLTPAETEHLYRLIRSLAAEGRAIVLITHKMADVAACANRVVVMRRGKVVDAAELAERSTDDLVRAMVGEAESDAQSFPVASGPRPPKLVVRALRAPGLRDAAFDIGAGEILGIAGVSGNGQQGLAEALAGIVIPFAGSALLDGRSILREAGVAKADPRVAYVPELPRDNGVAEALSVTINLALRRLHAMPAFPDWRRESERAAALMRRFDVRPAEPLRSAGSLSGGNLQKLVIARELGDAPELVIACYPAMGLDIVATHAIHRQLYSLAAGGAAVLWFSEDLDELLAHAHRIAVLRGGRIAGILPREAASRQALGTLMSGDGAARAALAAAA